jgi:hypothetical protein
VKHILIPFGNTKLERENCCLQLFEGGDKYDNTTGQVGYPNRFAQQCTISHYLTIEWTFEDVRDRIGASRGTDIGANNANQTSNQPSSSTGRSSTFKPLRRRLYNTSIEECEAADQVIGCAGTSSSQCLCDNVSQIILNNHPAATMTSRLVLVIGDLHIPDRALDIPAKVSSLPSFKSIF